MSLNLDKCVKENPSKRFASDFNKTCVFDAYKAMCQPFLQSFVVCSSGLKNGEMLEDLLAANKHILGFLDHFSCSKNE